MLSQNIPDFDALWNYSHPELTETKFREILLHTPEDDPAFLELLTQIARAQGLQRKFEKAHRTLGQVEWRLGDSASRVKVRYLLERGRLLNSTGHSDQAHPFFEQALDFAQQIPDDFYAVDALHMLAIISPPDQSLDLNLRAIQLAESSAQERALNWLGSLYNNTGWSYHDKGEYTSALNIFEKAEAWQRSHGRVSETRIAVWTVARALRSLGRFTTALSKQMALKDEFTSAGEADGFVLEEIAECLLALKREREAQPYFKKAYEILCQDDWFAEHETVRLKRIKKLGKID